MISFIRNLAWLKLKLFEILTTETERKQLVSSGGRVNPGIWLLWDFLVSYGNNSCCFIFL